MRTVGLLCRLVLAALKDFLGRELRHAKDSEEGEQLPPIRYVGDPTEIYLA